MPIPDLTDVPVLVTGGAGFIGSHLVDALVERGARVRVLDNFSTGRRANLARARERIELLNADLRDLAVCRQACEGVAFVFHQAALGSVPRSMEDPATTIAVNVTGTANLFAAAREAGVRRLVYASSSSVYGDSERLPKREGEEGRPLSPYAFSKVAGEQLAATFDRCFGFESVGLRYFNVYGPRQDPLGAYAAVIPRFAAACLAGEAPVIYGDGGQTRDFTYVADVIVANLLAAGAPAAASGRAFNIGAGSRTSLLDLARAVGAAAGRALAPRHEPARAGDVRDSLADLTVAAAILGFRAAVDLQQGLRDTVAAFAAPAEGGATRD